MVAQEMVQQLQHSPIADRIQLIEALLQSLKRDIVHKKSHRAAHKPFIVRTFDLGTDVQIDREEMYIEKGL